MLVIDRVVLQRVEQWNQIMRFRNKYAIRLEHFDDALNDGVDVFHVGKAIGGGDDARSTKLALDPAGHLNAEIAFDRLNTALVRDIAHIRGLNAEDALPTAFEVRQERAIVRADINDKIFFIETKHHRTLALQICKIVAQ